VRIDSGLGAEFRATRYCALGTWPRARSSSRWKPGSSAQKLAGHKDPFPGFAGRQPRRGIAPGWSPRPRCPGPSLEGWVLTRAHEGPQYVQAKAAPIITESDPSRRSFC